MIPQKNKKIKTAIIGLGKIAWAYEENKSVSKIMNFPTHLSVLRSHPKFQLVAAQDKNKKARDLFFKKTKALKMEVAIYADWEKMIAQESPDLLVVASNTESHIAICSRAINLGVKNILCEKPLSYSLAQAKKLVEKAKKKNCVLHVNYSRASNPAYINLIKMVRDETLGRIQSFDAKYSGGVFNNGTHIIDLLIRMFGEPDLVRGFYYSDHSINSSDPTLSAFIKFKNNVSGYIYGLHDIRYRIFEFELDILGEFGRLRAINGRAELTMKDSPKKKLIAIAGELYPVYDNIYSYFVSRNLAKINCSGQDSLKSLALADKLIKSIKK